MLASQIVGDGRGDARVVLDDQDAHAGPPSTSARIARPAALSPRRPRRPRTEAAARVRQNRGATWIDRIPRPLRRATAAYTCSGATAARSRSSRRCGPKKGQVTAWLVPLAWTPVGVSLGEGWQRVSIAADNIGGWVDQTFPPEDERAFVTPMRDLEMLLRVAWHAEVPEKLAESLLVNPEDVPEDVLDGLERPLEPLTQCAVCRRMCVREHFVWNDRQLCAWDYHATVFGKRGPWRDDRYEERFFETLPRAAYVAPGLLIELDVESGARGWRVCPRTACASSINVAIGEEQERRVSRGAHGRRDDALARAPGLKRADAPMSTNRAIARLVTLFACAYALLIARQFYVQAIEAPRFDSQRTQSARRAVRAVSRHDPRPRRNGARRLERARASYPFGAALAHAIGYASPRYGTSGLEAAFDADLAARPLANDPFAQFAQLLAHAPPAPARRGATVVTTIDPAGAASVVRRAVRACARCGRRDRSAFGRNPRPGERSEFRPGARRRALRGPASGSGKPAARPGARRPLPAGIDLQDRDCRRGARGRHGHDAIDVRGSGSLPVGDVRRAR